MSIQNTSELENKPPLSSTLLWGAFPTGIGIGGSQSLITQALMGGAPELDPTMSSEAIAEAKASGILKNKKLPVKLLRGGVGAAGAYTGYRAGQNISKALAGSDKTLKNEAILNMALPVSIPLSTLAAYAGIERALPVDKVVYEKLKAGLPSNFSVAESPLYSSSMSPTERAIRIQKSHINKPGILAHEIGHAHSLLGLSPQSKLNVLNNRIVGKVGHAGRLSSLMAVAGGIGFGDKLSDNQLLGIGAANAALSAPLLAEELNASAKGFKLIRRAGGGRFKALSAFAGVPSYLVGASFGSTPWLARKLSGSKGLGAHLTSKVPANLNGNLSDSDLLKRLGILTD